MKTLLFASAALGALALDGCAAVQNVIGSTGNSRLVAVAAKIDAGAQLAIADLPSACQIVGQIATLASAYSASGLAGGGAASTIAKTANGAAALAGSPLCQNPATADPVAASVQIIGAVAAIKAATAGGVSAPTAAASLPAGG
ncbi:hypothetical protein [Methylocapsa sp. S129]|uniref:hypothetical protein n=1 Tax=Methylocapsa sp. S129 TaxID=1641869 RepID=UPI00131C381E|nr:hypothetical protein [Methylocapsa sp. S129]